MSDYDFEMQNGFPIFRPKRGGFNCSITPIFPDDAHLPEKTKNTLIIETETSISIKHLVEKIKQEEKTKYTVELPCKVGDTVYWHNGVGYIHCCKCKGFYITGEGIRIDLGLVTPFINHPALFFSKAKADEAAKEARKFHDNL